MKSKTFYSNGKLLISGEYVVLDGAISLAVPTKYGQSLTVTPIAQSEIIWISYDHEDQIWFEGTFNLENFSSEEQNDISQRIVQILEATKTLNPQFLSTSEGFKIETRLDFPRNWGLGTSSSLINNIANWAHVDPYQLLEKTFGGSGYDIACAENDTPITYQRNNKIPTIKPAGFNPSFKDELYFVHLNKKQNSREGIKHYKEAKSTYQFSVETINDITSKMLSATQLEEFQELMRLHENYISEITKQATVKAIYFEDFEGAIKSLGAWGGDFVLVASKNNPTNYFKARGFHTVIPYENMVL
ncbi:GYDIA family GHMP kinase [Tamlana sp. 2_MG-2023]|uniref:GYDIA family GHMP kinase n=1 Tax=unclassified Tamlana TaxID=2614803 RepID=UPI0026E2E9D9|nr:MULTISPECIES: GYDIA family GHMP kinase [unclassified Tamlana]MDO6761619.1 GYDIA family GHMP kinase [Tamlana sp. 2_MG-2023]MDO6792409.1 GYDIA family GHMP kinase [Tamlana sp. 1_MG-2023]